MKLTEYRGENETKTYLTLPKKFVLFDGFRKKKLTRNFIECNRQTKRNVRGCAEFYDRLVYVLTKYFLLITSENPECVPTPLNKRHFFLNL